jgi:hypothetical protein
MVGYPEKKGQNVSAGGSSPSELSKPAPEPTAASKPVPVAQSKYTSMRRTQRVYLRTAIMVYGKGPDETMFNEKTHTVIVNANGALILMSREVKMNEKLLVMCQQTMLDAECYVAWVGELKDGKREVGIGFAEPSPKFWGMNFPPDDWDSTRRKLPTTKNP